MLSRVIYGSSGIQRRPCEAIFGAAIVIRLKDSDLTLKFVNGLQEEEDI